MSVLSDMAYCVGPKAAHGDGNACFLGTHRLGLRIYLPIEKNVHR